MKGKRQNNPLTFLTKSEPVDLIDAHLLAYNPFGLQQGGKISGAARMYTATVGVRIVSN